MAVVQNKREARRLMIEVIGVLGLIATLIFSAISTKAAADSATYAADSVAQSRASVDAAFEQLGQAKYQAVYQQQLDLWKLAIEHPERARAIIGGDTTEGAAERATGALVLDFYAYVYAELAPLDETGGRVGLALEGSSVTKPPNVNDGEWNGWISWSRTIADNFMNLEGPCDKLRDSQDGPAYNIDFRTAIDNAYVLVPEAGTNKPQKVCKGRLIGG